MGSAGLVVATVAEPDGSLFAYSAIRTVMVPSPEESPSLEHDTDSKTDTDNKKKAGNIILYHLSTNNLLRQHYRKKQ